MFNQEFLEEVFHLQETIDQIKWNQTGNETFGLEKICFAPMTYDYQNVTLNQCVVQSVFGYFGNSLEEFRKHRIDDLGYTYNYLNKLLTCMV